MDSPLRDMKGYCKCGKEVYANWIGVGSFCLGCFNDRYHSMNKEDYEFEVKQTKIKKNFDEKNSPKKKV